MKTGNLINSARALYEITPGTVVAGKAFIPDADKAIDTINGKRGSHFVINTISDNKQIRLNSRQYNNASGDSIGIQSKVDQRVTTTGVVRGFEMQPRVQAAVGCSRLVAFQGAPIIKGSSGVSGTVTNGVQCFRAELTDELGAGKTFGGDLVGYDVRGVAMESGHTYSANVDVVGFRMAASENSKAWDAVLKLASTQAGVWNDDPTTELNLPGGTVKGYIKVIVNNADRYIALYEIGNLAD